VDLSNSQFKNNLIESNCPDDGTCTLELIKNKSILTEMEKEKAISRCTSILGRTFAELSAVYDDFSTVGNPD
jgi:hypothetical protein